MKESIKEWWVNESTVSGTGRFLADLSCLSFAFIEPRTVGGVLGGDHHMQQRLVNTAIFI